MKIAVCDDDLIFQRQIKEELDQYYQSLDVLIEAFSLGETLLEAVCADPYGFFCVFMDIEMPGIDGMETTRRLFLCLHGHRNAWNRRYGNHQKTPQTEPEPSGDFSHQPSGSGYRGL